MTSLMNLGACVSTIAAGFFGAYLGRKSALRLACVVGSVAIMLQIGSTTPAGLYVGRFFLGFSNGFFVVFSTVYCSEVAPSHLRE
jgi:MFS family permease